ncbi:MAG TPA: alpha/beta hydrolase, partial [Acidimicrobiales bacterium]|nr:alpha/beta hydrolase [Acidimicrobiales bacterium]
GRAYEPMAAVLAERHHVYAIDFRGHGDTQAPANGRFDWDGMADDLETVVSELSDEPLAVFGHSMGGGVAMLVEQRRPGALRSAYLYEPIILPAIGGFLEGGDPMSENAARRRPSFPTKAAALMRYASRAPLNTLQAASLFAYVEHGFADGPDGAAWLKCRPAHEAATFAAGGKPTVDVVAKIETRTVIAVGASEGSWSPAMFGPGIVDAMPNATLERYANLGHFGPLQDPTTIGTAILRSER